MAENSKSYENMTPVDMIIEFLNQNRSFLNSTDRLKIILNKKGKSIIPEVTTYPPPLRELDKNK